MYVFIYVHAERTDIKSGGRVREIGEAGGGAMGGAESEPPYNR